LEKIFSFLDSKSIVSLSIINQLIYSIFSHIGQNNLWKKLSQTKLWKNINVLQIYLFVNDWRKFFIRNRNPLHKYLVLLRFRSHTQWEIDSDGNVDSFNWDSKIVNVEVNNFSILERPKGDRVFKFKHVYGPFDKQEDVYRGDIIPTLLDSFEKNNNICYFAYGPTGTGKTRTLFGPRFNIRNEDEMGIFPRLTKDLFLLLSSQKEKLNVKFSMFQVYNESIRDLMDLQRFRLRIISPKQMNIEALSEYDVKSADDVYDNYETGIANKMDFETKMRGGCHTSRAYLIVMLKVFDPTGSLVNQYIFCESSGSETVEPWEYWYAAHIARSHEAFHAVVHALSTKKEPIPYREGKITRLLKNVIDPNDLKFKMIMICTVSSHITKYSSSRECMQIADKLHRLNELLA